MKNKEIISKLKQTFKILDQSKPLIKKWKESNPSLPTRKEWEEFGFKVPDDLCRKYK